MIFVRDIGGVEKTWLHGTEHFTNLQNMTMFTGVKRGPTGSGEEISFRIFSRRCSRE